MTKEERAILENQVAIMEALQKLALPEVAFAVLNYRIGYTRELLNPTVIRQG